jgi:hypothetical protein
MVAFFIILCTMGNVDKETAFAALRQVVESLWSNQRRPILGSRLKKEFLDKLESQGLEFSEQTAGFKSFVDFVSKSGFLSVRTRPGTDMLVVPIEEAAVLKEPREETKERVRSDFWRAFVGFPKAGERRYFDPAQDQVLEIPESAVQPTLPEIIPFTKEEQLGWRREFAEKMDPNNPLRERLLASLVAPNQLHEFSSCLRSDPGAQNLWYRFLSQKVRAGLEEWAKKNGLARDLRLEEGISGDNSEDERRKLYSVLDKIPVDLLLDLTVPLRWLVRGRERE